MVGEDKHGNGSQWMISLASRKEFDGRFVGFGRVVGGEEIIEMCNKGVKVDGRGGGEGVKVDGGIVIRHERPMYPITVAQCDVFTTHLLSEDFTSWTKPASSSLPAPSPASPSLSLTILVIGPLSSGKTTLINRWCGSSSLPTPTTGFELDTLHLPPSSPSSPATKVTFYGLGGADNIKGYWPNYYDGAHAIVWVVDPASPSTGLLEEVRGHEMVKGKPVLMIVNARGGGEGKEVEGVRMIVGDVKGEGKEMQEGLNWLVEEVKGRWEELDGRVRKDVEERKRLAKEERERRREQIAKEKEDKERAEAEANDNVNNNDNANFQVTVGDETKPVEEEKQQELQNIDLIN